MQFETGPKVSGPSHMTTKYDHKERIKVIIFITNIAAINCQLEGKYSLGSTDPRESEIRANLRP